MAAYTPADKLNQNVFAGPHALQDYYNPDCHPPLPLVELPEHLNPFFRDGVRIYAKMMTMLPAHNVKALPALGMLSSREEVPEETRTVVEYSSGSTVISMSIVARVLHGITDVRAYLSNKTSGTKLRLMQFFGLSMWVPHRPIHRTVTGSGSDTRRTLFGGPSQPEPCDDRGGIQQARRTACGGEQTVNPNQYENDENWKAHYRWTGPQILTQLPGISVMCAGLGTSGTMTGIGKYLKRHKPDVVNLACCTAPGERVPGPRTLALMGPVRFPWKEAVDEIVEVGAEESYAKSMELCRNGLVCGPSSGFNLQGLLRFLSDARGGGTLDGLRGSDGQIQCTFICCDLPYQYLDEYFEKLGLSHFAPIKNQELTEVDLYRYDEAWELSASDALWQIYNSPVPKVRPRKDSQTDIFEACPVEAQPVDGTALVDLRSPSAKTKGNLVGAIAAPLATSSTGDKSPFADARLLRTIWSECDRLYGPRQKAEGPQMDPIGGETMALRGLKTFLVCEQGDVARVCSSVMRANGVEAYSMRGGFEAVERECVDYVVRN